MEDLQQAYAAYQQALYHLRDPKVILSAKANPHHLTFTRNPSSGMESVYSMIVTAPWNMRKKLSRR